MANVGRRPTYGQQFEAGQAGVMQHLRDQKRQRSEGDGASADTPPPNGKTKGT